MSTVHLSGLEAGTYLFDNGLKVSWPSSLHAFLFVSFSLVLQMLVDFIIGQNRRLGL